MQYRIINISDIAESEYQYYYSLMSDEKKARVDRFRFIDDKKRTVAGEMLARQMIAESCRIKIEDVGFLIAEFGKPFVKGANIEFNISHSDILVVCAINDSPIGVDIEKVRDINETIISRVCTNEELKLINDTSISQEEHLKRFFEIWTAKEAAFKKVGTGITDFKSFPDCEKQTFTVIEDSNDYIISIAT